MKIRGEKKPARFALVIFIGLVIFCMAQLSWWIVFQINLASQSKKLKIEIVEQKINHIVSSANLSLRHTTKMASLAVGDGTKRREFFDSLFQDTRVIGYSITGRETDYIQTAGIIDSTFYSQIGSNAIIYFDVAYPGSLINDKNEIIYKATGVNGGMHSDWIKEAMFEVAPEYLAYLEDDSRGLIVMYASEGSFFILVILFGAFLIYRTLQRSEDLKFRQQNFIHSVTHEFKTPLTSLRLYLETLQSSRLGEQKSQELFAKMLDDCRRIEGMVDNVLEAGRSGKEDYKLNLEETDLSNDLAKYLAGLDEFAKNNKAKLNYDPEPNIRAKTDFRALERAVRAIVENAVKYSLPEKRSIDVKISRRQKNALITVTDYGVGIPRDEQKKIFDRFYRINNDSTRLKKGSGLGLYLAQQTIKAHGGHIEVFSEGSDRGAVFTISLPCLEREY